MNSLLWQSIADCEWNSVGMAPFNVILLHLIYAYQLKYLIAETHLLITCDFIPLCQESAIIGIPK